MWRKFLAPGVLITGIVAAYFGGFPGEPTIMDGLQQGFGWLVDSAAHPKLFVALCFLFLGFVVVPNIIRFFLWRGDWEAFRRRQEEVLRDSKGDFHSLANRAYGEWVEAQKDDWPITLDALINQCLAPCDDCLTSGETTKVILALEAANPKLWGFCLELYNEIENVRNDKNYNPRLLNQEECKQFSICRGQLTSFWDIEGERILGGVGVIFRYVWISKIGADLQDPSIRLLPYLEAALATKLGRKKLGAMYLFRLSKIGFEKWLVANISV